MGAVRDSTQGTVGEQRMGWTRGCRCLDWRRWRDISGKEAVWASSRREAAWSILGISGPRPISRAGAWDGMGWDGVGWGVLWGEAGDPKKQSSELRDFDAPPQRLDCVGGPSNAVGSHRRGLAGEQQGQICMLESKGLGGGRLVPGVQVKRVELPD